MSRKVFSNLLKSILVLSIIMAFPQIGRTQAGAEFRVGVQQNADLLAVRNAITALGGNVLDFVAEYAFVIHISRDRIPDINQIPGVIRVEERKLPEVLSGGPGEIPALGALEVTQEEQRFIDSIFVPVYTVPANALAKTRALLQDVMARPLRVDNSLSQYFPPIGNQGNQGSCTAWAACYYWATYTQARDGGYDVSRGIEDSEARKQIASPAFMYPLTNSGSDLGAATAKVVNRLNEVGCASWEFMPYSDADYTTWPSESAWIEALGRRTLQSYAIDLTTPEGIAALKQHLANGNIAVTRTAVYSNWYYEFGLDGSGLSNGVLYSHSGASFVGSHAMTIVGYDDDKSFEEDGVTQHGAFLIANSWGNAWGTSNSANSTSPEGQGFMWAAYDYVLAPNGAFDVAYYNEDREDYAPRLYATAALTHPQRGRIAYCGGIGSPATPLWTSYHPVRYDGGYNLSLAETAPLVVDLTDGIPFLREYINHLFVALEVADGAAAPGQIVQAVFSYDFNGDGTFYHYSSADPIVTVMPGERGYARLALGGFEKSLAQIYAETYPGYALPPELEDSGQFFETNGGAQVMARFSATQILNLGYYQGTMKHSLLANARPGDNTSFQAAGKFGFYLDVIFSSLGDFTFYSEAGLNPDGLDHLALYSTPDPEEWFMGWEDQFQGGDNDHQDLVVVAKNIYLPLPPGSVYSPLSGRVDVTQNIDIPIIFARAVVPKFFGIQSVNVLGSQSGVHIGSFSFEDGNKAVKFDPIRDFAIGEQVTVTLTTATGLAEPYTFSFMIAPAQGAETFAAAPGSPYRLSSFAGDKTRNLVTADYNNDGHLDLLILRAETNHALIFLGEGDGTFKKLSDDKYLGAEAWPIYHPDPRRYYPQHVATGDLNADGKMDLAVCTADLEPATPDYVLVLYGLGDGWFGSAFPYQVGRDPWNAAIADLNGDGRQDIVVNNHAETTLAVLLSQNQIPAFAAARFYSCAHPANALAVGDYNNDARLDLAVVGGDKTEASAVQEFGTVFLGNGDGTFTTQRGFVSGEGPLQLANADCNEDGILDLVVANEDDGFPNYAGSKSISVLLGRGDGRFFPRVIHPIALTDCEPRAVTVADLDKDGHVDVIVAASGTGEIVVLRGDGKGNLANPAAYPVGDTPTSVVAGDFNHDGILDLAAGNYGRKDSKGWYGPGAISVLLGAPAATATETITFGETGNTDFAGVTQDAHIREIDFAQNRNYGNTTRLRVLGANAEKKEWRGLLQFDFVPGLQSRGVNAADQIISAKISLLLAESEGVKADQLSLHRLLRAWGEGAGDNTEAKSGEVTWLSAKHAQEWWASPGGDYLITPDAVQAVGNAPGTWCELNVTQAVKAMLAANANEGWLLILEPNAGMRYFHASEEYLTPAYRPKLTVVVQPALGKPAGDSKRAVTGVPQEFRLEQNYPNPFNPETEIGFALPEASAVKLTVFSLLGERVRTLVEQECSAGFHRVIWDGKDERGRLRASGIYLYRLQAGEFVQVKKMSLLR
ncbi:FG-GAP-like repeat-containing protein [bacterium]|nr:FG-GAP-like repeat-containing protein [bacterium]